MSWDGPCTQQGNGIVGKETTHICVVCALMRATARAHARVNTRIRARRPRYAAALRAARGRRRRRGSAGTARVRALWCACAHCSTYMCCSWAITLLGWGHVPCSADALLLMMSMVDIKDHFLPQALYHSLC